ncbi:MAG TPA: tRNA adenosine(34) deaminase TadA [Candidatus Brocadiia bacterium]|nr:tRNA adenosine(34) deaminase TadA [Candidatus Brocadiia bacterium]
MDGASPPCGSDEAFMREALREAEIAASEGEVPVGCVIVRDGEIIAREHNRREQLSDPTAHAEILALRAAGRAVGSWRLVGCVCYATLEPCCMCAGALSQARAARVVFGVPDPKSGGCGSIFDIAREQRLNHRLEVTPGILADECLGVLRTFFLMRRPAADADNG